MQEHQVILVSSFAGLPVNNNWNELLSNLTKNTTSRVADSLKNYGNARIVVPINPHIETGTLSEAIRERLSLGGIYQNIGVSDIQEPIRTDIFRTSQEFLESQFQYSHNMSNLIIVGCIDYVKWVLLQNQGDGVDDPSSVDYGSIHTLTYNK